ncbi:MAG TPA: hypothetical protein VF786_01360, partial [Terriglobales bacterium]
MTIRWSAFTASDGSSVAAGTLAVKIGANGAFAVQLVPNSGAKPEGSYYKVVMKLDDGTTSEESWVVPAVSTTTVAAVRGTVAPASVAAQYVGRDYVDSAIAAGTTVLPGRADVRAAEFAGGAKCDGVTDDTAAIAAAMASSYTVIEFPNGATCKMTGTTGTVTLPHDDETVNAGARCGGAACTALSAEATSTMPYSAQIASGKIIEGNGATIVGDFNYGTDAPGITKHILFRFAPGGTGYVVRNLKFHNSLVPFYADYNLNITQFKNVQFNGVGFPFLFQIIDRVQFEDVLFDYTASGVVVGGWWTSRNDYVQEGGGYADKSSFHRVNMTQRAQAYNSYARSFDTFFDTYFWKTANGDAEHARTRLTDQQDSTHPSQLYGYRGVFGVDVALMARYGRPSNNNDFQQLMHSQAARYAIFGGPARGWQIQQVNLEKVGYGDSASTVPLGTGSYTNPYLATKLEGFVVAYSGGGGADGTISGMSGFGAALKNIAGTASFNIISADQSGADAAVQSPYFNHQQNEVWSVTAAGTPTFLNFLNNTNSAGVKFAASNYNQGQQAQWGMRPGVGFCAGMTQDSVCATGNGLEVNSQAGSGTGGLKVCSAGANCSVWNTANAVPTGACTNGNFTTVTTTGLRYTCVNGAWQQDAPAADVVTTGMASMMANTSWSHNDATCTNMQNCTPSAGNTISLPAGAVVTRIYGTVGSAQSGCANGTSDGVQISDGTHVIRRDIGSGTSFDSGALWSSVSGTLTLTYYPGNCSTHAAYPNVTV